MPNALHRPQYGILCSLLVSARERAGLTQEAVARALGKPQSFVSKYERGARRLDVTEFVEVALVLGADPAELMAAYRSGIESSSLLSDIAASADGPRRSTRGRGAAKRGGGR
ncbi:helix-turn-helix domain-containing protein [Pseudothauera rhizosphaerae]|uniref:Helix-turn-helix transcriptional regulator n=1 Tax=Pseudothauera rhizosphaerae TaxID=2565932 RepID=A0A4S4APZ2_9RHOO|nr:helix-turn-helix transcriptional regulator [Pseudothauera rhizosphaerae]THF61758.1 helix-turn-helix transcriptional regulator [Pseudothauera rhizosphaerae]